MIVKTPTAIRIRQQRRDETKGAPGIDHGPWPPPQGNHARQSPDGLEDADQGSLIDLDGDPSDQKQCQDVHDAL